MSDLTLDQRERRFIDRATVLAEAHCSGMGYDPEDAHTLALIIECAMEEVADGDFD